MMNINCSENCVYEENGSCTLNQINSPASLSSTVANCAYYKSKTSVKNKTLAENNQ